MVPVGMDYGQLFAGDMQQFDNDAIFFAPLPSAFLQQSTRAADTFTPGPIDPMLQPVDTDDHFDWLPAVSTQQDAHEYRGFALSSSGYDQQHADFVGPFIPTTSAFDQQDPDEGTNIDVGTDIAADWWQADFDAWFGSAFAEEE